MTKTEKNSFILYHSFANQFALLPMEARGELISAIFQYERTGCTDPLTPLVEMAFSFIKETLDRDRRTYEEKCEQNAKNGKKGGRPKKDISFSKTERFFEKPKKADSDSDIDSDIDIESGSENGNESEKESDSAHSDGMGWEDSVPFAPHAALPESDTALTVEEEERLIEKGLPTEYVAERRERANAYATEHGRGAYSVLLEWWRTDRAHAPWNRGRLRKSAPRASPPPISEGPSDLGTPWAPSLGNSFDTDDFFQCALARSWKEISGEDG